MRPPDTRLMARQGLSSLLHSLAPQQMRILRFPASTGPPQRDRIMALDRDGKPLTVDIQPPFATAPYPCVTPPLRHSPSTGKGVDELEFVVGMMMSAGRPTTSRRASFRSAPLHHTVLCRAPPLGTVLGVELCGEPLQWDDVRPFRLLFSRLDVSETGRPAESKCRLSGQPIRIPWPVRTRLALAMGSGWIAAPLLFRACRGGSSTASSPRAAPERWTLSTGRPPVAHGPRELRQTSGEGGG